MKVELIPSAILLRWRVFWLCQHLRRRGISCQIRNQFRPRWMAHRFSMAYHIYSGQILLGALRALPGGRDLDGTVWYRPEWAADLPDAVNAALSPEVKENARGLASARLAYAEEGYAADDPRRLPNLASVPISKHVDGLAIDTRIDWSQLDGPWSATAKELVAAYKLCRPVPDEHWHFELLGG